MTPKSRLRRRLRINTAVWLCAACAAFASGLLIGRNHPAPPPQPARVGLSDGDLAGLSATAVVASLAERADGAARRYHRPNCGFARRINPANRAAYDSPADAESAGCSPCSRCRP